MIRSTRALWGRVPLVVLAAAMLATAAPVRAQTQNSRDDDADNLLELDRRFDEDTAENGVEGWVAYFAANGSMASAEGQPIVGPDAIRQLMAPFFGRPGASLRWKPDRAEILLPGDLGFTTGTYERRIQGADGSAQQERGRYVTVWRQQKDGSWKVVFDTGSEEQPGKAQ